MPKGYLVFFNVICKYNSIHSFIFTLFIMIVNTLKMCTSDVVHVSFFFYFFDLTIKTIQINSYTICSSHQLGLEVERPERSTTIFFFRFFLFTDNFFIVFLAIFSVSIYYEFYQFKATRRLFVGLMLYVPANSYGHVGTPNPFFPGQA